MEEKNLSSLVFGNVVLESQFLGTTPRITGRPALYDNAIDTDYTHSIGIQKGQI
ncbi:hypothetical protein NLL48_11645 [Corynebacterium tuberculostearicum]|nr:hypothetical protein NLL48_11645 [Corynebacterium tuberculostearicum]